MVVSNQASSAKWTFGRPKDISLRKKCCVATWNVRGLLQVKLYITIQNYTYWSVNYLGRGWISVEWRRPTGKIRDILMLRNIGYSCQEATTQDKEG